MKKIAVLCLMALATASWAAPSVSARVAGEKVDNGLGDLPHYRHWVDKSGKNPMGDKAMNAAKKSTPANVAKSSRDGVAVAQSH